MRGRWLCYACVESLVECDPHQSLVQAGHRHERVRGVSYTLHMDTEWRPRHISELSINLWCEHVKCDGRVKSLNRRWRNEKERSLRWRKYQIFFIDWNMMCNVRLRCLRDKKNLFGSPLDWLSQTVSLFPIDTYCYRDREWECMRLSNVSNPFFVAACPGIHFSRSSHGLGWCGPCHVIC